jgi:hypothetical protein
MPRHYTFSAGDYMNLKSIGNIFKALHEEAAKENKINEYVVTIAKNRPVRSLKANKYYHAILKIIAIDTGHTHDQLHEICKKKFNAEIVHLPKGGTEILGRTTSDLDTAEFAGYVNRVKQWAQDEFNIVIPELKDVDYKMWMEIETTYEDNFQG